MFYNNDISYEPKDWIVELTYTGTGTEQDPYVESTTTFKITHRVTGETKTDTMANLNTFIIAKQTAANVRGLVASYVVIREDSFGRLRNTTFRFATGAKLPAIAGGASLAVDKLIYTFPAGEIYIESVGFSVGITQTQGHINSDTPDVGLGTTLASGANAVLSYNAACENILTGQTFNNCTGTREVVTTSPGLVIATADAHTVYLNVADGWAASGDAGALLSGTVTLNWRFMS